MAPMDPMINEIDQRPDQQSNGTITIPASHAYQPVMSFCYGMS